MKDNKSKNFPFSVLRKGILCTLIGTTALAGGLLVGCDESAPVEAKPGTQIYWGTEDPQDIGRVGDYYIESDDGDLWCFGEDGWEVISNIVGPQGIPGKPGQIGPQGPQGIPGAPLNDVTIETGCDADGNVYMDYIFSYVNQDDITERVYPSTTLYVGTEMTLQNAFKYAAKGGKIVLKNSVSMDSVSIVNKKVTLDLAGNLIYNEAGNEIWNDTDEINDWSLISVRAGGDLTIVDSCKVVNNGTEQNPEYEEQEGGIYALEGDCYAIDVQEGGKCTINGGCYKGNISAVYVHSGEAIVNDGDFVIQQLDPNTNDSRYTLNCYNANYANQTAKITVNGGTFINFNPAIAGDDGNYVSANNTSVSINLFEGMEAYMVCPVTDAVEMLDQLTGKMSITLTENLVLPTQGVVIKNGVDLTVNLNGYTISAPNDEVGDGVFHVVAGGKLTIEGDGYIKSDCKSIYKMAVWADGGEITINGGHFSNWETDGLDTQYDLIYASNGGSIVINGGEFDCKTPRWTLNVKNNSNSNIIVKGGTFKNYDPSASMTDENVGNVPPTNFMADGYVVQTTEDVDDIYYTVVKE